MLIFVPDAAIHVISLIMCLDPSSLWASFIQSRGFGMPFNVSSRPHTSPQILLCERKHKDCEQTVEPVQTPHLILCDELAPCQSCIQVHQSFGIHGVHESQDVTDFVSRHVDEIRQPNPCNRDSSARCLLHSLLHA